MCIFQKRYSILALLLIAHHSLCQQTSSTFSSSQTKVQLEDIERDNLKSAQVQSSSQQVPQQYVQYPSQDQQQFVYNLPVQQSAPVAQTAQQPAQASQLFAVPNQQLQQALFTPNQQQLYYFTQSQQPTLDFAGVSLYPSGYPYVVPQSNQASAITAEYLKALQANTAAAKTAGAPLVKTVPSQVAGNFILPASLQQPLYQPITLSQAQSPAQFYYNYYPVQAPAKSFYAAGVKSTTPVVPVKAKEEPYVPIGGSGGANYRIEYPTQDQLNFGKVRLTG